MKHTKDEIEGPIRKSGWLLAAGILMLVLMLALGIFLLVEALQTPEGPQDVLDMKRMLISGVAVLLFSAAVLVFLISLYKPEKKKTRSGTTKRKPARKKSVKTIKR